MQKCQDQGRYTHFLDPSCATRMHYEAKAFYPSAQLERVEEWLGEEQTRPLVLATEGGCGTKTLLTQWVARPRKTKLLTILHFASNGGNHCNYYYSLYRIIISLREALRLKQNVDLLEENIRKFFAYWLDLVSSEVHKQQIIHCADTIYDKVLIVIEGVHKFLDLECAHEANIAFWLPQLFPKNVKVILTAQKNSETLQRLVKQGCETIQIEYQQTVAQSLLNAAMSKQTSLPMQIQQYYKSILHSLTQKAMSSESKQHIYSLIQFYSNAYLPSHSQFQLSRLQKTKQRGILQTLTTKHSTAVSLLNCLYTTTIESTASKDKTQLCLLLLGMTQKGLTKKELTLLTQLSEVEVSNVIRMYSSTIIHYEGTYAVRAAALNKLLLGRSQNLVSLHQRIAKALQSTDNCIRKLQEQTYHLYTAKSYFKLKEVLSNIENFLLLFNPNTKYQLSKYWQKLEEKGFDPVIQYNKAIEGFSMHYHPTDENIFRIIVQISKFLKQFCDFQTWQTPQFRHPYIQGNMLQLHKIGLLKQLSELQIFIDNSFDCPDIPPPNQLSLQCQINSLKQKYFTATPQSPKPPPAHPKRKTPATRILSQIQELNVDVPMNREKVREYYLQQLRQCSSKENAPCKEKYLDVEDAPALAPTEHPQYLRVKERQTQPTLYYYKRWIWIQFPWVCISLHNNYSTTPQLRRKIAGDDHDSVQMEQKYTRQALMVAVEAREKKKQMFTRKVEGMGQSGTSKKNKSSFILMNRTALVQPQHNNLYDCSIAALIKELEARKRKVDTVFVSEVQEQRDVKFISVRRQFNSPSVEGVQAGEVLPKLRWAIKEHTNYELNYIKVHIAQKKKQLNKIIYENKQLLKQYTQLRVKESMSGKYQRRKGCQLEQLQVRKEDAIRDFCKSLLQKERLKIIIKICSENKTKNEEHLAALNYLLQNMKKIIGWEKESMKRIVENMEEKKMGQMKREKESSLQRETKAIVERQAEVYLQHKQKLEEQIEHIEVSISNSSKMKQMKQMRQMKQMKQNKHREENSLVKEQEIRDLQDRRVEVDEQYEQLREIFGDGVFQNSQQFKSIIEEQQRSKELKIAYFQRENRLNQVKKELERAKEKYKRELKNSRRKSPVKVMEKKKMRSEDTQMGLLLDNIMLKIGANNKNEIIDILKYKINTLKKQQPQKYQTIIVQN